MNLAQVKDEIDNDFLTKSQKVFPNANDDDSLVQNDFEQYTEVHKSQQMKSRDQTSIMGNIGFMDDNSSEIQPAPRGLTEIQV